MSRSHPPSGGGSRPADTPAQAPAGASPDAVGDAAPPAGHRLPELVEVMRRLLAPDGCPWDREQTLHTLIPFLVEESYEVIDAIEHGEPADHCDELGDLMMQVVFQAALRQAEGAFAIDDVIGAICDKLVRRHPHVFGDASADTSAEVLAQWDRIKARERRERGERPRRVLDRVPRGMAPLERAHQLMRRAAVARFDWPDAASCRGKLDEELRELDEAVAAGDRAAIDAEFGDVLLAAINLGRHLGCDPPRALRDANGRFYERFAIIEDELAAAGRSFEDADLAELDALWDQAKARIRDA